MPWWRVQPRQVSVARGCAVARGCVCSRVCVCSWVCVCSRVCVFVGMFVRGGRLWASSKPVYIITNHSVLRWHCDYGAVCQERNASRETTRREGSDHQQHPPRLWSSTANSRARVPAYSGRHCTGAAGNLRYGVKVPDTDIEVNRTWVGGAHHVAVTSAICNNESSNKSSNARRHPCDTHPYARSSEWMGAEATAPAP